MATQFNRQQQQVLKAFLERRHPDYAEKECHWDFLEDTYYGGRKWFAKNIFKYLKEGDKEYQDRIARCYRFNHTRESVDLIQKYIFKSPVSRNVDDATKEIKDFWKSCTLSDLDIDQFMRLSSTNSSIFGRPWVFVDSNLKQGVVSQADAKESGARVYAYIVKPQNILDIGFDDAGGLNWILVRETTRDDKDPILATGKVHERFRLWEKTRWRLFEFEQGKKENEANVILVEEGEVTIGEIPAFPADHVIGDHLYSAPGLIEDIAYLDRATANYLSNLDAIIQDQTFSQLAMPAQSIPAGDDAEDKLMELGTKRVFTYDGEGGSAPEFLSPDPKQAGVIVTVINKIISEIYNTIGASADRTQTDNAVSADNTSGVAKAYNFDRLNSLLTSKAAALENVENKLVRLVSLYHSQKPPAEEIVKYPETFDVRSLYDEFTIAERLAKVSAPDGIRREQMKQVIDKLFPQLSKAIKDTLLSELKQWPKDPVAEAARLATATATATNSNLGNSSTVKNASSTNRQGQVTADTQKKTSVA